MLENERVCPKARRRHGSPDWPGDERAGLWQRAPPNAIGGRRHHPTGPASGLGRFNLLFQRLILGHLFRGGPESSLALRCDFIERACRSAPDPLVVFLGRDIQRRWRAARLKRSFPMRFMFIVKSSPVASTT